MVVSLHIGAQKIRHRWNPPRSSHSVVNPSEGIELKCAVVEHGLQLSVSECSPSHALLFNLQHGLAFTFVSCSDFATSLGVEAYTWARQAHVLHMHVFLVSLHIYIQTYINADTQAGRQADKQTHIPTR